MVVGKELVEREENRLGDLKEVGVLRLLEGRANEPNDVKA